jgi:hypothetical protein
VSPLLFCLMQFDMRSFVGGYLLCDLSLLANRVWPLAIPTAVHPCRKAGVEVLSGETQAGQPFNPELHEGIMRQQAPPGVADDTVLSVLRAGYKVGDRLVRPALVIVAQE